MRPKSNPKPGRTAKGIAFDQLSVEKAKRRLLRDALRPSEQRDIAFRHMILSIPPGKVSSYGGVAAAAGYPRYHRAVARLLRQDHWDLLPWHRVLGADGEIKTSGASAREQKARLRAEGVNFEGKKVNRRAFLTLPMIEGDNHDAE